MDWSDPFVRCGILMYRPPVNLLFDVKYAIFGSITDVRALQIQCMKPYNTITMTCIVITTRVQMEMVIFCQLYQLCRTKLKYLK